MVQKNTPNKKDLNPLHYNHKHASLKAFAEHLGLVGKGLRTAQSYPQGFHRLRYFGFLHCRSKQKLQSVREQLGQACDYPPATPKDKPEPRPFLCPKCREPMILTGHRSRAPPWEKTLDRIWKARYAA